MDRFFRQTLDRPIQTITPLDRLAYLGDRGMGALEYEPALPVGHAPETVDLAALAQAAHAVLAGKTPDVLNQLRIQGGSPGGARPKVTVALADDGQTCQSGFGPLPEGYHHWLVKFRAQDDPPDMGRIEQVYTVMARLAGVETSESRLIPVRIGRRTEALFAARRFDRNGHDKRHVLTLSGYLYASHRYPSVGYDSVLGATLYLTRDVREVERAFRLMVFNVLTHNKDDHEWRSLARDWGVAKTRISVIGKAIAEIDRRFIGQ